MAELLTRGYTVCIEWQYTEDTQKTEGQSRQLIAKNVVGFIILIDIKTLF